MGLGSSRSGATSVVPPARCAAEPSRPNDSAPSLSSQNSITHVASCGSASIRVLPHFHTIYCDRRREVCTAEGAIREANRLQASHRCTVIGGSMDAPARQAASNTTHMSPVFTWYRAKLGFDGLKGPVPFSSACLAEHFIPAVSAACSFIIPDIPALNTASHVEYDMVRYFELTCYRLTSGHAEARGVPGQESPLFSSDAAWKFLQAESAVSKAANDEYMLGLMDIGRYIAVSVTCSACNLVDAPGCIVGPVQPAPPRIRELWLAILGDDINARPRNPHVGDTLCCKCLYFGGTPGHFNVTWIRVDADGNRSEDAQTTATLDAATMLLSDQCFRVLRTEDAGCTFKVMVEPVRSDGVVGAASTSKPTLEVVLP